MVAELTGSLVEGTVSRTNATGILLEGRSTWLNISKYATAITLPEAGEFVRLQLDKQGYIRRCDLDACPDGGDDLQHDRGDEPDHLPDRDRRIMRQAVVNTATAILSSAGPASVEDVISVAEQLERWVLR
jgi:hypothetical protein